ncbi:MAG: CdaR family protein [Candidatus Dormibacteria bacterium]
MSRLARNWRLKLVALLFASTTWVVVAYAGNPVVAKDVPKVAVQAGPPPNNWVMVGQLPAVSVSVSGLQQSLNTFRPDSLHATVDLSGTKLGPNLVRVHVDNADPRVLVTQVQPAALEVVLDERASVIKKVDVRYIGKQNACCAQGAYRIDVGSVKITGPKSVLATANPQVFIDITDARSDVSNVTADVKLANVDPRAIPLVTIDPAQVHVTVPITPVTKGKSTGILVVDVGEVAPGYRLADTKVSPDVVFAVGDPAIIEGLAGIPTAPVSVNGATSDVVQTVTLKPPNGVTIAGSTQVTVHIFIVKNSQVQPTPTPSASPSP